MTVDVVVKLGGGEGIDPQPALEDLAERWKDGERWVLVHGGSFAASDLQRRLGLEPRFVTTQSGHRSRFTDRAAVEALTMAIRGQKNLDLVARLQRLGVNAVGLSGVDGRLVSGPRKDTLIAVEPLGSTRPGGGSASSKVSVENGRRVVVRGDHSAKAERVNAALLDLLVSNLYAPVVTIPVLGDDGEPCNADGDRVAALIASALGAPALVVLSNVPGLLRDVTSPTTLVAELRAHQIEEALSLATGGMRKKLLAGQEGVHGGIERVIFSGANRSRPVSAALAGSGTRLVR